VKNIYLLTTALAVSVSAFADTSAEERDFGEFAASGCKNRNGDFCQRRLKIAHSWRPKIAHFMGGRLRPGAELGGA
jgi:hypothetical protein